jgi:LysM repeat protein
MKIILPFKETNKWKMTQKFGEHYLYGGRPAVHQGVDWAMPKGTPIIAPLAGKVVRTTPERKDSYGKAVYILTEDQEYGKIEALCAHLSELSVYPGLTVKQGEQIGKSGNTGFWRGQNGYHLHFGIKVGNNYIDPLTFYKKINITENLFNQNEDDIKDWLGAHLVVTGDNLWKIAQKFYGSGSQYNEIFLANQDILSNPNNIKPGQLLRIPALKNKGL